MSDPVHHTTTGSAGSTERKMLGHSPLSRSEMKALLEVDDSKTLFKLILIMKSQLLSDRAKIVRLETELERYKNSTPTPPTGTEVRVEGPLGPCPPKRRHAVRAGKYRYYG